MKTQADVIQLLNDEKDMRDEAIKSLIEITGVDGTVTSQTIETEMKRLNDACNEKIEAIKKQMAEKSEPIKALRLLLRLQSQSDEAIEWSKKQVNG